DPLVLARARVDGVLQVSRKYQHRSVLHSHDDLVGILGRELDDRGADDPGLIAPVMKVAGVRAWMGPYIVHIPQEVVLALEHLLSRAFGLQPLRRFPPRARLATACPSRASGDRLARQAVDGKPQAWALLASGPYSLPAARSIVPRS